MLLVVTHYYLQSNPVVRSLLSDLTEVLQWFRRFREESVLSCIPSDFFMRQARPGQCKDISLTAMSRMTSRVTLQGFLHLFSKI